MNRESMLKVLLLLVGLLFSAAIFPLVGGVLHPADSDTGDTMMMSLYFAFEMSTSFLGVGGTSVSRVADGQEL